MANNSDLSSFGNHSYSVSLDLKQATPHVLLLLDMAMLGSLTIGILEVIEEQGEWYEEPFLMAAIGALVLLGLTGFVQGMSQVHFDDDQTRWLNACDALKTIAYTIMTFYAAIICLPIAYVMEVASYVRRGCRLSGDQDCNEH